MTLDVAVGTLTAMTTGPRPQRYDPVQPMPLPDGTKVHEGALTLRVFATPSKAEHRLLSVISATVSGGKLVMKFTALPVPDRREQLMRMRRQRLQR